MPLVSPGDAAATITMEHVGAAGCACRCEEGAMTERDGDKVVFAGDVTVPSREELAEA